MTMLLVCVYRVTMEARLAKKQRLTSLPIINLPTFFSIECAGEAVQVCRAVLQTIEDTYTTKLVNHLLLLLLEMYMLCYEHLLQYMQ